MIPRNVIITRSWIVSTRAKTVYLICAILFFATLGALIAIHSIIVFGGGTSEHPYLIRAIEFLIVVPRIFATATLWVAMWYHWYGYNKDGFLSRSFWFLSLFYLGPVAAVFYYFFPYRWNFKLNASETVCKSSRS